MHGMLSLLILHISLTVDIITLLITFTYYMHALIKVDQYYILPSTLYTKAFEEILTCNLAKSVAL